MSREGDEQGESKRPLGPERLAGSTGKELFRKKQVQQGGRDWEHDPNQALEQESGAETRSKDRSPEAWPFFLFIYRAQKRPHAKRDRERGHPIPDLDAREEK